MNTTAALRPLHAWFFFWERVVPSLYRVVATGLAALATALLLTTLGLHPLLVLPASLAGWIGLAIAQEHDERILLPADQAFVDALRDAVSVPPLALSIAVAHGPKRARSEPWDTMVVLIADGPESHPLAGFFIAVERSVDQGWMRLHVSDDAPGSFESIDDRLAERGETALGERIQRAQSPEADAHAIAAALTAAYW